MAAAVAALQKEGVKAFGRALDVTDRAALLGWVEASAEALGGIDIAVANVSALDMNRTDQAFINEFQVDLLHTVRTVDAALPHLERSKAGAIVVISSVSGLEHDFTSPAYGTFKAALIHYASRMASELAGKHIRVNSVSPGNTYFEGGIWQRIERELPDLFKDALGKNPWGRMATDQEVANAAVFLASLGVQLHHRREPGGRRRADPTRAILSQRTRIGRGAKGRLERSPAGPAEAGRPTSVARSI